MTSTTVDKLLGILIFGLLLFWATTCCLVVKSGLVEAGREIGAMNERSIQRSFDLQKAWQAEQLQRLRSHTNLRADAEESDG